MRVDINLHHDLPQLHAVQFSALVKHYLAERTHHLDPITIKGYRLRLNYFLEWWNEEGPQRQWLLDAAALGDYAHHLHSTRLGWHSRQTALKRLRQVLKWAHQRHYVAVDFSEFVPAMKGSAPPRPPLEIEVLRRMLEACEETKEPARNRAMIAVLAGTGVRCEECANLRVENVLFYTGGSGIIRVLVAKNDDPRNVAFDNVTGNYLCDWIVMLPYLVGPLFPCRNGRNTGRLKPLHPRGLHDMFCRIAEIAGVRNKLNGPHDFRRMFATTWARTLPGYTHLLQKQMGHASFQTTMLYILGDSSDVREVMTEQVVSPLALLET